jgi:hypothetical protein
MSTKESLGYYELKKYNHILKVLENIWTKERRSERRLEKAA